MEGAPHVNRRVLTTSFKKPWCVVSLIVLALVACTTPSPARQPSPADAKRLVWFAPQPGMQLSPHPYRGSVDYAQLLRSDEGWKRAAEAVDVFKFYSDWVALVSDGELRRAIRFLNQHGIAIALEAGPLEPTAMCGAGVEGFGGPDQGVRLAERIRDAGGSLAFVTMASPFAFGTSFAGPNGCQWSIKAVANKVQAYVSAIHEVFPDAVVGDIEPLWNGGPDTREVDVDALGRWMNAYRRANGDSLPFLLLDPSYTNPEWQTEAARVERLAHVRNVKFGLIYHGNDNATTDAEWMTSAQRRVEAYETQTDQRPDYAVFQSWHDKPDHLLPDTDPDSFTSLLLRYARSRTAFDVKVRSIGDTVRIAGKLVASGGRPVARRRVDLSVTPLSGLGPRATYSVTGTVPQDAKKAVVGVRVNTECGCSGPSNVRLYGASYQEGAGDGNRVPDPTIEAGLPGWFVGGNGTTDVVSESGGNTSLMLRASPSDSVSVNSLAFPVDGGSSFTATFRAAVSAASVGSGYFTVIFLGNGERGRERIPLEAKPIVRNSVATDGHGKFGFALRGVSNGSVLLTITFDGTHSLWPQTAERRTQGSRG